MQPSGSDSPRDPPDHSWLEFDSEFRSGDPDAYKDK